MPTSEDRRRERIANDPAYAERRREQYRASYHAHAEKRNATARAKHEELRPMGRHYLRKYGITEADFDRMMIEQGGVCYLCFTPPQTKRLHVDHDHETGAVRGLLCGGCNRVLGFIEARPGWTKRASNYLRRNLDTTTPNT